MVDSLVNALDAIDLKLIILLIRRSMRIILSDLYLFLIFMLWLQRLRKRHRPIDMMVFGRPCIWFSLICLNRQGVSLNHSWILISNILLNILMSLQLDNIFNSWGSRKWVEGVFGGLGSVDRLNWGVLVELVGLVAEVKVGVGVYFLGILLLWVLLVLFLSKLAWLSNLVIMITLIYPAILPTIIMLNIPDRHFMIIPFMNSLILVLIVINKQLVHHLFPHLILINHIFILWLLWILLNTLMLDLIVPFIITNSTIYILLTLVNNQGSAAVLVNRCVFRWVSVDLLWWLLTRYLMWLCGRYLILLHFLYTRSILLFLIWHGDALVQV